MSGYDCCVECKSKEDDPSKLISCMYCFSSVHFKCRNIIGNAIRKIKESMYFCSSKCSEIYKKIIEMQNSRTTLITDLSNEIKTTVANVVSAQIRNVKVEISAVVTAIEESQQFLSEKFDGIVKDIDKLKLENYRLSTEIEQLKSSQQTMTRFVNEMEVKADKVNRDSISNNAVILGIPAHANEHIPNLVAKMAHCIGFDLPSDALVSATRVSSSKNSIKKMIPIRVVFKHRSVKELFFSKKKKYGELSLSSIDQSLVSNSALTNIYVRDELTPLSLELLQEMRKLQKKMNLKYVWAGRDGVILVKRNEKSVPEMIKNRNDLLSFVTCPSPNLSLNASSHKH